MIQLQAMREKRKLTQAQLAVASGVTQQAISAIETGERPNPGIITLHKLATALKCTVDDLIETDEKAG
ncbi:MAG: helix-turn-helix domain-containing protein [Clostridiales bacterium]|nr:helix-turn-helix domain-containing protein [Clostridiales bacterium]